MISHAEGELHWTQLLVLLNVTLAGAVRGLGEFAP